MHEKVEELIKDYPECGQDDRTLFLAYLVLHHDLKKAIGARAYQDLKQIILNSPSFESIRRARQKLQQNEKVTRIKKRVYST